MEKNLQLIVGGAKSYVYWAGFNHPVLSVAHPDTVKAILKTSEPKSEGTGGYNWADKWLGQ